MMKPLAFQPANYDSVQGLSSLKAIKTLYEPTTRLGAMDKIVALPTADLCDKYYTHSVDETIPNPAVQVLPPLFRDYGGKRSFAGPAHTIKCFENNPLVRKAVTSPGNGRVLVVDGGGSTRCALLGDMLADEARNHGWAGIIVNGCIRDSEGIGAIPELGVKALATCPLKSSKRDPGVEGVPVVIGGCTISPGDWVYADPDGVLIAKEQLSLE